MLRLSDLALPLDHSPEALEAAIIARLGLKPGELQRFTVVRRGNDARNKRAIKLVYVLDLALADEARVLAAHAGDAHLRPTPDTTYRPPVTAPAGWHGPRPVVIGAGPCGLLAALIPAALDVGAAGALGAELAAILPVQGVAGFGTYEAGAAAALLPSGVALGTGLQVALALHLFVIAVSVSGGALAWLVPVAAPAEASAPDADPSADVQSASSAADSTRPAP